jgi:hypothetical protein
MVRFLHSSLKTHPYHQAVVAPVALLFSVAAAAAAAAVADR